MDEKQKKAIKKYFAKEPVAAVYLFGSQATGRVGPISDVDFAILFSNKLSNDERFDKKLDYIGELSKIMRTDSIDVVDLAIEHVPLKFAVLKGKSIFVSDNQVRVEFESAAMDAYFDYQYYINRRTQRGLAALKKAYGTA